MLPQPGQTRQGFGDLDSRPCQGAPGFRGIRASSVGPGLVAGAEWPSGASGLCVLARPMWSSLWALLGGGCRDRFKPAFCGFPEGLQQGSWDLASLSLTVPSFLSPSACH